MDTFDRAIPDMSADTIATRWDDTATGLARNAQLNYVEELHHELGRIAGLALPGRTIDGMLKRVGWDYDIETGEDGRISLLRREIMDGTVGLVLPEEDPGRGLHFSQDEEGITIRARKVTGSVVQQLLEVERQLIEMTIRRESTAWKPRLRESDLTPKQLALIKAEGKFLEEDDLFTDTESIAVAEMTHTSNFDGLAETFGTTASTISRLLKPARERVGAKTNLDLMLIAIAAGIADIDHVPENMTAPLNKRDLEMIRGTYSPDPAVRVAAEYESTRWHRMYDKMEIERSNNSMGRWLTVLYAVKDGIIELPDPSKIEKAPGCTPFKYGAIIRRTLARQ